MALIQCPECKSDVSSTAFKCPRCGHQLRKPKRSFMGKLFKWSFILFNVIMVVWLIGYWKQIGDLSSQHADSASQAGVAIGATLGTGMLFALWVVGDIILGLFTLFTRPRS